VIALHEAFGRLGPEPDDSAITRDALFPVASLTKPVVATALMALVEEGRVGLTRPVREYIPEFDGDGRGGVCVHHLLTHTSGVEGPGETLFDDVVNRLSRPPRDADLHPIVDAVLQIAYERSLRMPPGAEMYYENFNYVLLGEIVRRVTGRRLCDVVHERIFDPLGMVDSQLTVPAELTHRVVRATPETPLASGWAMPLLDVPLGSIGVCSTARDMAVFGQAFLDGGRGANGRILGRATVAEMVTNQIPGIPGVLDDERHDEASWGYGWLIAGHEKWAYYPTLGLGCFNHGGSGVFLWCDPKHVLVGAFFAPATKESAPDQLLWHVDLFTNVITAAIED
jgi:CubicO group peptidase (beta-lactamase class C family)